MLRKLTLSLFSAMVLFGLTTPAHAHAEEPDQIIMVVSEQVLDAVKAEKETFKNNPQPLKTKLLTLMEPHTDFESFAKGVMGGYYDEATPEQREKFMHDFKSTLIDLYTKALVAFEVKEMKVQDTNYRNAKSASVVMVVTSPDENTYLVQYSMRKDDADKWVVRNVVLDGVNLGLTYRNQFKSAMETNGHDLDKVILGWASTMKDQEHETQ